MDIHKNKEKLIKTLKKKPALETLFLVLPCTHQHPMHTTNNIHSPPHTYQHTIHTKIFFKNKVSKPHDLTFLLTLPKKRYTH